MTGAISLASVLPLPLQARSVTQAPNLLVIHTDQQSLWTLGAYGGTLVATPNIDSLARDGVTFTNFFTNHAVCTASRGCLLTGRYPHAHGAWWNDIPLNGDEVTLAHALRAAGYETSYAGKWHLAGEAKPGWMTPDIAMGSDDCRYMFNRGHWKRITEDAEGNPTAHPTKEIGDEKTYTTDWLAAKTIDVIHRKRTKPFFHMVSIPDPHDPFKGREPYLSMFDHAQMPLPETFDQEGRPDWSQASNQVWGKTREEREFTIRKSKAMYLGLVKCIDDAVGRILAALEASGQARNTIVVFTTDHGEFMGEHGLMAKGKPYDTAYHLPMLIRWPAKLRAGQTIERVCSTVDFMPTMLGLMGVAKSGREQGGDLSALLTGGELKWTDEAFMHLKQPEGKLSSHLGVWTRDYELAYVQEGEAVLFDRRRDPHQVKNLFQDPAHQNVVADLTGRLLAHCEAVGDSEAAWLKTLLIKRDEMKG